MKSAVREWPRRMREWMEELRQNQQKTTQSTQRIERQVSFLATQMARGGQAESGSLAQENAENRERLLRTATALARAEQRLASSETERARLEAERVQGLLREESLSERIGILYGLAQHLRADKEQAYHELDFYRKESVETQAVLEQASQELNRLREEAHALRASLESMADTLPGPHEVALREENARLERALWLAESEARLETQQLRQNLEEAWARSAAEAETRCVRLRSENDALVVLLKKREDLLSDTAGRLTRILAAQEHLELEARELRAREAALIEETAEGHRRERELHEKMLFMERELETLREHSRNAGMLPFDMPSPSGNADTGKASETVSSEPRLHPWPHILIHNPAEPARAFPDLEKGDLSGALAG